MPIFASESVTDLPSLISNLMGPVPVAPPAAAAIAFFAKMSGLATAADFLRILVISWGKPFQNSGGAGAALALVVVVDDNEKREIDRMETTKTAKTITVVDDDMVVALAIASVGGWRATDWTGDD